MCKKPGNFERGLCLQCAKKEIFTKTKSFKQDFFGSVPSPFIGRYNYPNVNIGMLSLQEVKKDAREYDNPRSWAKHEKKAYDVLDYRSNLVNARQKGNVHKINEMVELVGIAKKPVDAEVHLNKKPFFRLNLDSYSSPYGPNTEIEKAKITENVKVSRYVDKVNSDTDLKSVKAMQYLYKKGYDETFLTRVLSVGSLGIGKDRKLVPTRWSITAVDDSLGKKNLLEFRDFKDVNELVYFGGYMGNSYLILFMPGPWSYELFEIMVDKEVNEWSSQGLRYATDHENWNGRKEYVKETAGGYYAARLPITEKLKELKRKGSVLAFRFITEEYQVPLGVWVVREAARKALMEKPLEFGDSELMIKYAKIFAKKKFGMDISDLLKKSHLLKERKTQKRLGDF